MSVEFRLFCMTQSLGAQSVRLLITGCSAEFAKYGRHEVVVVGAVPVAAMVCRAQRPIWDATLASDRASYCATPLAYAAVSASCRRGGRLERRDRLIGDPAY